MNQSIETLPDGTTIMINGKSRMVIKPDGSVEMNNADGNTMSIAGNGDVKASKSGRVSISNLNLGDGTITIGNNNVVTTNSVNGSHNVVVSGSGQSVVIRNGKVWVNGELVGE